MILPMRTRSGRPIGSVAVLTKHPFPKSSLSAFPHGTSATLLDRDDVAMYVEKYERLLTLSDDLRWLAQPQHFDRIVTITEIPTTYGRREMRDVLKRYANVNVVSAIAIVITTFHSPLLLLLLIPFFFFKLVVSY